MHKIYNNVEGTIVFVGSDEEFIEFARKICKENEDFVTILDVDGAKAYIKNYCDNLVLIY